MPQARETIRFGDFEADLAAGELRRNGLKLNLRDKSFQVLAALLEKPGQLVTRDELYRRLWPGGVFVDFDNNLNTAVVRLRAALQDSADHPRFIETVPKRGYRFIAQLSTPARILAQPPRSTARVLVLPFVNLSGDPSLEYLGDAVTEELIAELARIAPQRLGVIARTTSMHFKGAADIGLIGRSLNVDHVVEGSIRRTHGGASLTAQLIRVKDQTHVWAGKYEAGMGRIFSAPGAVAMAVAEQLEIAPQGTGRRVSSDPWVHNLYLQGRRHLHEWTPKGFAAAVECFDRAIALDPAFALAHDALAETHWTLGFNAMVSPKDSFSKGIWAALRAVEIDNTLAETHALLGMYQIDYNWPEVDRRMARALELNPASPDVKFRYALYGLMPHGRLREAAAEIESALESDPLSLLMRMWLVMMLDIGRQYDRALAEARRVLELDPNFLWGHVALGHVLRDSGSLAEAVSAFRTAAELSGDSPVALGLLGQALGLNGVYAEARALLARLHQMAESRYVPQTSFAWIHLALGELDCAFSWLDRAIEERDPRIAPIKSWPFLDPIRPDPRFRRLLEKMNLTP